MAMAKMGRQGVKEARGGRGVAGASSETNSSGGATRRSGGERSGKTATMIREFPKPASARISNRGVQ